MKDKHSRLEKEISKICRNLNIVNETRRNLISVKEEAEELGKEYLEETPQDDNMDAVAAASVYFTLEGVSFEKVACSCNSSEPTVRKRKKKMEEELGVN